MGSEVRHLFVDRYDLLVEKFDDVAFESAGGPGELIQTKHCRPGNLTDLSEDLWGTPRIWSECVRD